MQECCNFMSRYSAQDTLKTFLTQGQHAHFKIYIYISNLVAKVRFANAKYMHNEWKERRYNYKKTLHNIIYLIEWNHFYANIKHEKKGSVLHEENNKIPCFFSLELYDDPPSQCSKQRRKKEERSSQKLYSNHSIRIMASTWIPSSM